MVAIKPDPDIIGHHYLFNLLEPHYQTALLTHIHVRQLARGDSLFYQGDVADNFFLWRPGR